MKKIGIVILSLGFAATAFAEGYPTELNQRPLTTPMGQLDASASINSAIGLTMGGSYGIHEMLAIGATMTSVGGAMASGLSLQSTLLDNGPVHLAGTLGLALSAGGTLEDSFYQGLSVGLPIRANIMDDRLSFQLPVALSFNSDFDMGFALPLNIAYQANAHINIALGTVIASQASEHGAATVHIGDIAPITVTTMYTSPKSNLDIGVSLTLSNLQETDTTGERRVHVGLLAQWHAF